MCNNYLKKLSYKFDGNNFTNCSTFGIKQLIVESYFGTLFILTLITDFNI